MALGRINIYRLSTIVVSILASMDPYVLERSSSLFGLLKITIKVVYQHAHSCRLAMTITIVLCIIILENSSIVILVPLIGTRFSNVQWMPSSPGK